MIRKLCPTCGSYTSSSKEMWEEATKMMGGKECFTCWKKELILSNLSSFTPKELAKMIKLGQISLKEIETGQVEG